MDVIKVKKLKKSFNGTEVVKGIDLNVKKGELFALLGPNGAGKTTTINMLSTLLKPDSGEAWISGKNLSTEVKEVRKKISLTGQFASLDEGLTGIQNLILISRLHGYSRKEASNVAERLLQSFGLAEAKTRSISEYSGGMRRRLDIAASMVTQPELIFLDEPTTGLDPQSRIQVWEVVRELLKQGTTVLLTTQYLEEADQLADRIGVIDHGEIIAEGTPQQLKASIGQKTLSIQFKELSNQEQMIRILYDHHAVNIYPSESPLVFKIPIQEAKGANEIIQTLFLQHYSIEYFSLEEPSLDEVFLTLTASKKLGG